MKSYAMNVTDPFEKILKSYETYYDINRDDPEPPFEAEAVFHSHDKQYFLMKSAKLGETESNEYVFFAKLDFLDTERLKRLDKIAWEKGICRVKPHSNHRNTDIALIIVSEQIEEDAFSQISKISHYKSYRFGFQGWSHYRLIVLETSSGHLTYNRQGQSLKELFDNIFQQK